MSKSDRKYRANMSFEFECATMQEACDAITLIQDRVAELFDEGQPLEKFKQQSEYGTRSVYSYISSEVSAVTG